MNVDSLSQMTWRTLDAWPTDVAYSLARASARAGLARLDRNASRAARMDAEDRQRLQFSKARKAAQ